MTDRIFRYLAIVGILNIMTLLLTKHQLEDGEIKSAYMDYVDQLKDVLKAEQKMNKHMDQEGAKLTDILEAKDVQAV